MTEYDVTIILFLLEIQEGLNLAVKEKDREKEKGHSLTTSLWRIPNFQCLTDATEKIQHMEVSTIDAA